MLAALSVWWIVGWAIGLAVVVVAATLLVAIIALGRRIVRQGDDLVASLDGTRDNTAPLFDVAKTNLFIDHVRRDLLMVRKGERS